MQVKELIEELKKFDENEEVKLCFYFIDIDDPHKKCMPQFTNFQVKQLHKRFGSDIHLRAIMPKFEDSVCMVGGHNENCQCHMGYVAEWRNK